MYRAGRDGRHVATGMRRTNRRTSARAGHRHGVSGRSELFIPSLNNQVGVGSVGTETCRCKVWLRGRLGSVGEVSCRPARIACRFADSHALVSWGRIVTM
ncbi:hypothetical protein BGZ61DRAFT_197250 [Ilyonectria robusta]|uniref:uncharacterized protein n=1 Tax=Ilyonectria robusta TaxID=1079257 RepID=UPI001E8CD8CC|nr:uncharacterized protein BGZ61DRAFT_197250 [Ilyonectria robusta]KAH8721948.1 hypothetical protein BGZ61DRAFT_197250 [Ilyonectria robusta]